MKNNSGSQAQLQQGQSANANLTDELKLAFLSSNYERLNNLLSANRIKPVKVDLNDVISDQSFDNIFQPQDDKYAEKISLIKTILGVFEDEQSVRGGEWNDVITDRVTIHSARGPRNLWFTPRCISGSHNPDTPRGRSQNIKNLQSRQDNPPKHDIITYLDPFYVKDGSKSFIEKLAEFIVNSKEKSDNNDSQKKHNQEILNVISSYYEKNATLNPERIREAKKEFESLFLKYDFGDDYGSNFNKIYKIICDKDKTNNQKSDIDLLEINKAIFQDNKFLIEEDDKQNGDKQNGDKQNGCFTFLARIDKDSKNVSNEDVKFAYHNQICFNSEKFEAKLKGAKDVFTDQSGSLKISKIDIEDSGKELKSPPIKIFAKTIKNESGAGVYDSSSTETKSYIIGFDSDFAEIFKERFSCVIDNIDQYKQSSLVNGVNEESFSNLKSKFEINSDLKNQFILQSAIIAKEIGGIGRNKKLFQKKLKEKLSNLKLDGEGLNEDHFKILTMIATKSSVIFQKTMKERGFFSPRPDKKINDDDYDFRTDIDRSEVGMSVKYISNEAIKILEKDFKNQKAKDVEISSNPSMLGIVKDPKQNLERTVSATPEPRTFSANQVPSVSSSISDRVHEDQTVAKSKKESNKGKGSFLEKFSSLLPKLLSPRKKTNQSDPIKTDQEDAKKLDPSSISNNQSDPVKTDQEESKKRYQSSIPKLNFSILPNFSQFSPRCLSLSNRNKNRSAAEFDKSPHNQPRTPNSTVSFSNVNLVLNSNRDQQPALP